MKYRWTSCPQCQCEVAVNFSETPAGRSGSLRRWSRDRTINDGRRFEIGLTEIDAEGGFSVNCVCGRAIPVPARPDAVSAEREEGLRVTLGS
jgi:hypothetical protein